MSKRLLPLFLLAALTPLATDAQPASEERIVVSIDATKTRAPISPYLYGQFIEHIGDLVNRSVWAEMLDDRKFYYEINSQPAPSNPSQGPMRRRQPNRWRPIGPDAAVVMDCDNPYVGEHTPLLKLAGPEPRGIQQAGLVLRKSKGYSGRVVLAGEPGASVSVSLVWGPDPGERQTIPITGLKTTYAKFPLQFTVGGDTDDGRIEIAATGAGSFHVGAVSLMPADNIRGFRPDIVSLLKQLRSGMYRFPGGNFLSAHEWRDAIGDPDRRPPRWDHVWAALQPNDVGTDEFLTMCELLGVDAFISVNAGFGDAHSAAQLVEYVNGAADTPMGKLRAANGHAAPYNVKWWGIGNEMYGTWQFGYMPPRQFVIKHNMFAEAMRAVDPSIKLVGSGASLYQMHADSRDRPRVASPPYAYDGPFDWSGNLLRRAWQNMDYISEHIYGPYGMNAQYYDAASKQWVRDTVAPIQDRLRRIPDRALGAYEEWVVYLERMPWLKDSGIGLVMDEWSTGGGDMAAGLTVALTLNEMFRHTDAYVRSDHTCAPCAINYNRYDPPVLRTNGLVFKMLANNFGTLPILDIGGNSPQPQLRGTVGIDVPRTPSGSPTYPLDVMAALSGDRQQLTITVVNPSATPQQLQLQVVGATLPRNARAWTVSGPDIQARNLAGETPQVRLTESTLSNASAPITVAPFSINLYQLQVR